MKRFGRELRVGIPFLWLGLIIGLSFVHNTVSAKAMKADLTVDLMGAGKMVFTSLNKMEIYLAIVFAVSIFFAIPKAKVFWTYILIVLILIFQSIRFLPEISGYWLDSLKMIAHGKSTLEFWYFSLELVKSFLLLLTGFFALKEIR
ncbi:hypothetical protein [Persicobacter psychrovividus]|uniref:hypothetical protein n=1 Tax=Persicobacter psychrovividus TaxID=387638 RepID=UPI0030CA1D91